MRTDLGSAQLVQKNTYIIMIKTRQCCDTVSSVEKFSYTVALSNRSPAWRHQPEVLHLTQYRPSGPKVDLHARSPMRRTCWFADFMNALRSLTTRDMY